MSLIENSENGTETPATDAPALGETGQSLQPETAEAEELFTVELEGATDSPEVNHNQVNAARRVSRKMQSQIEQQVERLKAGQIDDGLRVDVEMPPEPNINDYLSEDAVANKYDYDTVKAQAAFQQANTKWLRDCQTATASAQAKQQSNVNDFLNNTKQNSAKIGSYYDAAEKLDVNFDEVEKNVSEKLPAGWYQDLVSNFGDKAPKVMAYLDKNPSALAEFSSMDPVQALLRFSDLTHQVKMVSKKQQLSSAPDADTPITGNPPESLSQEALEAKIDDALENGNLDEYRRLKALRK